MKFDTKVQTKWLLAGAMALGIVAYVPTFVQPAQAARDRGEPADFERTKTIDEVPREVRKTIDAEARDHKVDVIQQVRHKGKEFYRVVITVRGNEDKLIRVSTDGKVITKEDVADADWSPPKRSVGHEVARPAAVSSGRERSYMRDEDVKATIDKPQVVDFDHIPPSVRAMMGREAEGEPVTYVVAYRDKGNVIYQTNVKDSDNAGKTRVIQVTSDGRLYGEANVGGKGGTELKDVRFDDAPAAVRETVQREAGNRPTSEITASTRRGRTVYSTKFAYKGGFRYLTVDPSGKIMSDVVE